MRLENKIHIILFFILITSNLFIINAQVTIIPQDDVIIPVNTEDVESTRNFMIETYNQKIQDHVLILFTIIGGWYTFYKILVDDKIKLNKILKFLIIAGFIWISVYSFGRLVYWSQYNSLLLMVKPVNRTNEISDGFKDNMKWRLHDAVIRRIRGIEPYNDMGRSLPLEIAKYWSLFWFSKVTLPLISLIISFPLLFWDKILAFLQTHLILIRK